MSVKKLNLWIGGEYRPAKDNAVFIDHNPIDDRPYAEVAKASADERPASCLGKLGVVDVT